MDEADIELRSAKDVEYIELIIPGCRRSIQQQSTKLFREEFPQPLPFVPNSTIQGEAFAFSAYRKKWYSNFIPAAINKININVRDVLSNSREQTLAEFQAVHRELDITIGLSPNSPSVDATPTRVTPTPSNINNLRPTTDELLNQCPRFRILVIGQSGVGKSTLINKAFGIEKAVEYLYKHTGENTEPGKANIEEELVSPDNNRFVLHDSKGFEPADGGNCEDVRSFIEGRKKQEKLKDKLHAVWLCFRIPIPGHGDRLLEDGAETFLKADTSVLRDIPTIIVFTKYDKLLTYMEMEKAMHKIQVDPSAAAEEYLENQLWVLLVLRLLRDSTIKLFASGHGKGREELIDLTHRKVTERFKLQTDTPSPVSVVTSMAQRTLPNLKIQGSIDVGRQRYWRTLTTGANFEGHTITECLEVIHTDIVRVWNFNDPSQYLYSVEFRGLMAKLAGTIDGSAPPRLAHVDTTNITCNVTLKQSNTARAGSPLMLLTPLILPFEAGLSLVQWIRETYQRLPNVHHKFMAYILDLIHVFEILFSLTANSIEKKLTRGAISSAFNAYYDSEMLHNAHIQIKAFDYRIPGPDPVLQEIISLVGTSPLDQNDISRALRNITPESLAQDDQWFTNAIGRPKGN
ncbi:hypothetical protein EDC04DRAFT_2601447 [Pisolithus marmoratus]|nr:hypothetical protein EDC04DRAFT_2601447 [Pisolithus marmoratus]